MDNMNVLIPNELGIWIECCKPDCKKWRYTLDFDDPLLVPKKWYCCMNSDQSINSCSIPECLNLEEDEIFVESKFKAGCIVWAKVMGHPWSPAMVDFCPEYECYYWFDNLNTNVPSQYHVIFLSGKQITRAWVKSRFIKSFAENEDSSFALKARVCGKKLSPQQRASIIEGWTVAKSALRLSIARRLKKLNFNSWWLSQRFQNPFVGSGKTPPPSSDSQSSEERFENAAGPSKKKQSPVLKSIKSKKPAQKHQSSKPLRQYLEKPAPSSTKRVTRAETKGFSEENTEEKKFSGQKKPAIQDSEASVESGSTNTERVTKREDLDDTRSINSFCLKDLSEAPLPNAKPTSNKKKVVQLRLDNGEAVDTLTDEIDMLDEIIPSSQESEPTIRSLRKIVMKDSEADDMEKENQPVENSSVEMESVGSEEIVIRRKNFHQKKFSLSIKLMNGESGKGSESEGRRSMSGSLIVIKNSGGDYPEESRYRRVLSEFKPREQSLFSSTASYPRAKIPSHKAAQPRWFVNPDERRKVAADRLERVSRLSEEEDKRMYQENRASLIAEFESVNAGPSGKRNRTNSKAQNYPIKSQNGYDYLLSSDDDSF